MKKLPNFMPIQEGNDFGLLINQYLIVHNKAGELVDAFRWTSEGLVAIRTKTLKSKYFGEIKPCKGDIYQRLVIDSFTNNQVTMVRGLLGLESLCYRWDICSLSWRSMLFRRLLCSATHPKR